MKGIKYPWYLAGADFTDGRWHSEPTGAYQMMIEFLRLSPSYELARIERSTGLSKASRKKLPKDFDKVLATYDVIGELEHVIFREWWLSKGIKIFGKPYSKPDLHEITVLSNGQATDFESITKRVLNVVPNARQSEGLPATLLMSVPLNLKRSEILKKFRTLLDKHLDTNCEEVYEPKISIQGKRFHVYAMSKGLRLIWLKAEKQDWELWRLGAKANVSPSYSKVLDPEAPRKPKDAIEMDDRSILGRITFRSIRKYERIAENAARGNFPCEDEVEYYDFDYPKLAQRLKKYQEWVFNEKRQIFRKFIRSNDQIFKEVWELIPEKDRVRPVRVLMN